MGDDKILNKIRGLLEQAGHPNTGEAERDTFLAKADQLMVKYTIDEAMIPKTAQSVNESPVVVREKLYEAYMTGIDVYVIEEMLRAMARLCRIRCVRTYGLARGEHAMVGFQRDIDYFQMMFLSVYVAFHAKMSPQWNPDETQDANIYRLKEAGVKWSRIAEMGEIGWPDGGKLIRAYKRECKRLDIEPTNHTQRHEAYRNSYQRSFSHTIIMRVGEMQNARDNVIRETSGAELALVDQSGLVDETFWSEFPDQRPLTVEELAEMQEKTRLHDEAQKARWEALTPKQRAAAERKNSREWDAYYRGQERQNRRLTDARGHRAGRRAAESVDLSGGRTGVRTATMKEI